MQTPQRVIAGSSRHPHLWLPKRTTYVPATRPTELWLAHSLEQVVAHADRIGDCGEGRVHRADADEEAGVDNVQVVEPACLAVHVDNRRLGVAPEASYGALRRNPRNRSVEF